jgi:hypothetical protein
MLPGGVLIETPGHLDIVDSSPTEVEGRIWGRYVDKDIVLRRDGGLFVGDARWDGNFTQTWRTPVENPLSAGVHHLFVSLQDSYLIEHQVVFAISNETFDLAFMPAMINVNRSDDPFLNRVDLAILGPRSAEPVDVTLSIEETDGLLLTSNPPELRPANDRGVPAPARTSVPIVIRVPPGLQSGRHTVSVRAEGPPGTEPRHATLIVNVDGEGPVARPSEEPFPREPHVESYRVRSTVTTPDTPGTGNRANAIWRLRFGCADGRCDAEVRNGGPRGGMAPFVARYVASDETYRFNVTQALAGDGCSEQRLTGRIMPETWDDRGPVRFRYELEGVTRCTRAKLLVSWEGIGRRR